MKDQIAQVTECLDYSLAAHVETYNAVQLPTVQSSFTYYPRLTFPLEPYDLAQILTDIQKEQGAHFGHSHKGVDTNTAPRHKKPVQPHASAHTSSRSSMTSSRRRVTKAFKKRKIRRNSRNGGYYDFEGGDQSSTATNGYASEETLSASSDDQETIIPPCPAAPVSAPPVLHAEEQQHLSVNEAHRQSAAAAAAAYSTPSTSRTHRKRSADSDEWTPNGGRSAKKRA